MFYFCPNPSSVLDKKESKLAYPGNHRHLFHYLTAPSLKFTKCLPWPKYCCFPKIYVSKQSRCCRYILEVYSLCGQYKDKTNSSWYVFQKYCFLCIFCGNLNIIICITFYVPSSDLQSKDNGWELLLILILQPWMFMEL